MRLDEIVSVLNVNINAITMEQAVKLIEKYIIDQSPHLVATANAEMVMLAQEDKELAGILNKASLVVPDGAGVVWAARHYGFDVPERVAGYDLTQELFKQAAKMGYKIYMFGAAPGIAEKAKMVAENRYPGVRVVGVRDGYFSERDEGEIIDHIKKCQPDILLTALGVPKQEKWLSRHLINLNVPVSMGVGGTFDVMSGTMKRAPKWMQRANLEWMYRLLSQPQRAIRMMALPRFVFKVIMAKKY